MADTKKLILAGGGGFGREVAGWAAQAHQAGTIPKIHGFIDDNPPPSSAWPAEYLGPISSFSPGKSDVLLISVGGPAAKSAIAQSLRERKARFARLVHPTAVLGGRNEMGDGVILAPYTMNTVDTRLGDFVTILSFSGVGHDASVGQFTTISSHVDIMGGAQVGEGVFIGSGGRVLPKVVVEDEATIGAGAVALRRVGSRTTIYAPLAKSLSRG